MSPSKSEIVFQGNGVSPGIILGTALKLDSHSRAILKTTIRKKQVDNEIERFRQAIRNAKEQLAGLRSRLEEKVGKEHSFILDVHILMLEDKSLLNEIESIIRNSRVNAEWAVREATDRIRNAYESLDDEYFRERGCDIGNVVERILINLSGHKPISWESLPDDLILVSHDLSPSSFATLNLEKVHGIALEGGGRTSHVAILARSLRLPAVMELREFISSVTSGDVVLLNGDDGLLVVNPIEDRLDRFRKHIGEAHRTYEPELLSTGGPSLTRDGHHISLLANIELPHEVRAAKQCGVEGIGLFRSEFLFFAHPRGFPNANEQYETYRMLVQEMNPYPVAIRTLDTGAERIWIDQDSSSQPNPSMGLRGIRLSLVTTDFFSAQIEGILRAREHGNIEIVLPMVSTVEEVWEAKEIIDQVCCSVYGSPRGVMRKIRIGAMIEVPAAVLALESLAKELDFLCVGTNDLIQYLLAVDRNNPQVSYLCQPLHPSVLSCLRRIADVSLDLKKPARICGEISANPFFVVLLIGMGYRYLSMNTFAIPTIRRVVAELTVEQARELSEQALKLKTAQRVADLITEVVPEILPINLDPYLKEIRAPEIFPYPTKRGKIPEIHIKKSS